ncbi:MAG: hypothetical protein M3Z29_09305 [Pseudomonadota bacterium]|nr:hypothetical protein [Pseudomonadota bacterium]
MKALTTLAALLCLGVGVPTAASASCFFVFGGDNQLIYRSTRSPVDLSKQIHDGMRARFPGAHLTMIPDETGCPEMVSTGFSTVVPSAAAGPGRSAIDASPLFRGAGKNGGNGDGSASTGGDGSARAPARRLPVPAAKPAPAK